MESAGGRGTPVSGDAGGESYGGGGAGAGCGRGVDGSAGAGVGGTEGCGVVGIGIGFSSVGGRGVGSVDGLFGKECSNHVPGTSATGRSQVALRMTPCPG